MAETFAVPKVVGDKTLRLTLDLIAEESITKEKFGEFDFALDSTRIKGFRLFCHRDALVLSWRRSWASERWSAWANSIPIEWDGDICEWTWDNLTKSYEQKLPKLVLNHYDKLADGIIARKNTSNYYAGEKRPIKELLLNGTVIVDIGVALKLEKNGQRCKPWWHSHGPKFRCADGNIENIFKTPCTTVDTMQKIKKCTKVWGNYAELSLAI